MDYNSILIGLIKPAIRLLTQPNSKPSEVNIKTPIDFSGIWFSPVIQKTK